MNKRSIKMSFSKRTMIALALIVAMALTLMPIGMPEGMTAESMSASAASKRPQAGSFAVKKGAGLKMIRRGGKKLYAFKSSEKANSDSLEEAKGMVREFIENTYETNIKDKSMYSAEVWKEISNAYSKIGKMIDGATRIKDLYTTDGFFAYLNEEMAEEVEIMSALGSYIKHYVKGSSDLPKLVKKAKSDLNLIKKDANKKYFNNFYWGRLQNLFADAFSELKKVKSIRDYILTVSKINEWYSDAAVSIQNAAFAQEENILEEEDEEVFNEYEGEEILIDLSNGEDEFIIIIDYEDEGYIRNKNEVNEVRNLQVERLKAFVERYETAVKSEKEKMDTEIEKFRKNTLDKIEDAERIEKAGNDKLRQMMIKAGVKIAPLSKREFVAAARQFNELTSSYSQMDYYETKWGLVEKYFFEAKEIIEGAEYNYELYGVMNHLKKKLGKIDTIDKQFDKEKKNAKKEIKAFSKKGNRKRYNQKKVRRVIKKGVAAINKVEKYDIDKLRDIKDKYVEKAEKCINKYRIKTSKKGKGTITKSHKVIYGDSFTVELMPKAGFKIKKVTIDGKKKKLKNKYIFNNVRKKHKVKVVFGK